MRKGTKRILGLGLLAGASYAAWRAWEKTRVDTGLEWQPRPLPYPPEPVPATSERTAAPAPATTATWVDPEADGECPATHPVKAKLASGIFHQPGGANYARTQPDRCYLSPEAAVADGLRPAKR
jgi:hypothetical protein